MFSPLIISVNNMNRKLFRPLDEVELRKYLREGVKEEEVLSAREKNKYLTTILNRNTTQSSLPQISPLEFIQLVDHIDNDTGLSPEEKNKRKENIYNKYSYIPKKDYAAYRSRVVGSTGKETAVDFDPFDRGNYEDKDEEIDSREFMDELDVSRGKKTLSAMEQEFHEKQNLKARKNTKQGPSVSTTKAVDVFKQMNVDDDPEYVRTGGMLSGDLELRDLLDTYDTDVTALDVPKTLHRKRKLAGRTQSDDVSKIMSSFGVIPKKEGEEYTFSAGIDPRRPRITVDPSTQNIRLPFPKKVKFDDAVLRYDEKLKNLGYEDEDRELYLARMRTQAQNINKRAPLQQFATKSMYPDKEILSVDEDDLNTRFYPKSLVQGTGAIQSIEDQLSLLMTSKRLLNAGYTQGFRNSIDKTKSSIIDAFKNFAKQKVPRFQIISKVWKNLNWPDLVKKYKGGSMSHTDYLNVLLGPVVAPILRKMSFFYMYIGRCEVITSFDMDDVIDELYIFPLVYDDLKMTIRAIYKVFVSMQELANDDEQGSMLFAFLKTVYYDDGQPVYNDNNPLDDDYSMYDKAMFSNPTSLRAAEVPLKSLSKLCTLYILNLLEQSLLIFAHVSRYIDRIPDLPSGNNVDVDYYALTSLIDDTIVKDPKMHEMIKTFRKAQQEKLKDKRTDFKEMLPLIKSKFSLASVGEVSIFQEYDHCLTIYAEFHNIVDKLKCMDSFLEYYANYYKDPELDKIVFNEDTMEIEIKYEGPGGYSITRDYNKENFPVISMGENMSKYYSDFPSRKKLGYSMIPVNGVLYLVHKLYPGSNVYNVSLPELNQATSLEKLSVPMLSRLFVKYPLYEKKVLYENFINGSMPPLNEKNGYDKYIKTIIKKRDINMNDIATLFANFFGYLTQTKKKYDDVNLNPVAMLKEKLNESSMVLSKVYIDNDKIMAKNAGVALFSLPGSGVNMGTIKQIEDSIQLVLNVNDNTHYIRNLGEISNEEMLSYLKGTINCSVSLLRNTAVRQELKKLSRELSLYVTFITNNQLFMIIRNEAMLANRYWLTAIFNMMTGAPGPTIITDSKSRFRVISRSRNDTDYAFFAKYFSMKGAPYIKSIPQRENGYPLGQFTREGLYGYAQYKKLVNGHIAKSIATIRKDPQKYAQYNPESLKNGILRLAYAAALEDIGKYSVDAVISMDSTEMENVDIEERKQKTVTKPKKRVTKYVGTKFLKEGKTAQKKTREKNRKRKVEEEEEKKET